MRFLAINFIANLKAGAKLELVEDGFKTTIGGKEYVVAKFSKGFQDKLAEYKAKGYEPTSAEIRFIVSWTKKPKEDRNQIRKTTDKPLTAPILLVNLYLRKTTILEDYKIYNSLQ